MGFIGDSHASWKYTDSSITWKILRRIWVQLPLDEWPETTSHQKWQEISSRHIKSCTIRRTWFIHEFLYFINFSYTGNCNWHWNSSNRKKWKCERGIISTGEPVAWISRNRKSKSKWRRIITEWWVVWCAGLATEFKHGLVDESVPEHRDASSSSHELLLEARAKVVPSTYNIFTLFPKDRNWDICLRAK